MTIPLIYESIVRRCCPKLVPMSRVLCAVLLGCASPAAALVLGGALKSVTRCHTRRAHLVCEEELPDGLSFIADDVDPEELEAAYAELENNPTECSGRIVTEFKDLTTGGALPERMTVKMRAIQGEFSPPEDVSDTERDDGMLLAGLVGFPTQLPLKVISQPDVDVDGLVRDMAALAAESKPPELTMRPGGRASISFEMECKDPNSLGETRTTLLEDPRIKMVF